MSSAIFFSDIHLEDGHSEKTKKFIFFLESVASRYPQIFILGDLFDVWPKTNRFFFSHYAPVLEVLKRLVASGIRITYFEGNHDFNLKDYFLSIGLNVFSDGLAFSLGDKKIFLTHGDMENPNEKGYRLFRSLVRSRPFNWILFAVPGSFLYFVSKMASSLSRNLKASKPIPKVKLDKVRAIYHQAALKYLERDFDVVMIGHIHMPEIKDIKVEFRKCLFINTGDWIKNFTYVTFSNSEFCLHTF